MIDYGGLKRLAERCNTSGGMELLGARCEFHAAANPAAVLELVAEIERLVGCDNAYAEVWEKARGLQSEMDEVVLERDQLKAEVEALRADAVRVDFMQAKGISVLANEAAGGFSGPAGHEWSCYKYGKNFSTYGEKLRDTIDAAMSKEAGQ